MMQVIRIVVKTEPVAKGRPRTTLHFGRVWTFTPQKTKTAQEFLKARLLKHTKDSFPPHTSVKLTAVFYRTKSKYLPRKELMPFRKPDLDNFLKLLLDAINGILVEDDAQITSISAKKRWTTKNYGYITIKLCPDKG